MITTRFRNGLDSRFPRTFDQLFDQLMTDANGGRTTLPQFVLRADALEMPDAFEIRAAVPGFAKENISIDLHEGKLTISGERKLEQTENQKFHLLETSFGKFSRTFLMPENVNLDGIKASFDNGMLTVTLPKDEQKILRRKIEIQAEQPILNISENQAETTAAKPAKNGKAAENSTSEKN